MSHHGRGTDPTAQVVLRRNSKDPFEEALGKLEIREAQFLVAHVAYEVPVSILVELFKHNAVRVLPGYDYLGHVHGILAGATRKLRESLTEAELDEEADWRSSPAVQRIATQLGLNILQPCRHCRQEKLEIVSPVGRRRRYCSDACRQAAYRHRRAHPNEQVAAGRDSERGMMPCFIGLEARLPLEARFELILMAESGAITIEQERLEAREIADPDLERDMRWRWNPDSPLRRSAHAALALLADEGVNLDAVDLHRAYISRNATHYVGFECRYLPAAMYCFEEYGGAEWLEIPRPSLRGPLLALRIRAVDRDRIAQRLRGERTYFT